VPYTAGISTTEILARMRAVHTVDGLSHAADA
jgi:hypothetical protein